MSKPAEKIETAVAGHHDVEYGEVEREVSQLRTRRLRIGGDRHPEPFASEVARQQRADSRVVVDDKDVRRLEVGRGVARGGSLRKRHRARSRATASRVGWPSAIRARTASWSGGSIIAAKNCSAPSRAPTGNPASTRSNRRDCTGGQVEPEPLTFGRGEKEPMASVRHARSGFDTAGGKEIFHNPVEALLRDTKDVQQLGDREARLAHDEMEHAVVRTPEAEVREETVRVPRRSRDRRRKTPR